MRNVYIINPKAGKHDHTVQFMERIRAVHATHGEEPEIYLTQRAGHGEELARAAAEKGDAVRIWAVGGDGTVLEVVRGAEFHKNAAVGCIPVRQRQRLRALIRQARSVFEPGKSAGGQDCVHRYDPHAARRCREHLLCGF